MHCKEEQMLILFNLQKRFYKSCVRRTIIKYCFLLQVRLPPEVNRILYIRNLPYKISAEEMYDIFGKYGAIRQIRV